MENCPVCNKQCVKLVFHLYKQKDELHLKYIENVYILVDDLILNTNLYAYEILKIILDKNFIINEGKILNRIKIIEPKRIRRIYQARRTGKNNPVYNEGVIDKIKNTIKEQWNDGKYDNRINGMTDMKGVFNPKFNMVKFLRHRYLEIYKFYHGEDLKCSRDDCNYSKAKYNIHHIDEDHNNFLLTNLECLCIPHHSQLHYPCYKPDGTIEITKEFTFDSCHKLLNYIGKCAQLHGHTYKLQVTVKRKVNQKTGMVMDFGTLKDIVNEHVIENLDHKYINDCMENNPTAENMLFWIWNKLEKDGLLKGLHKIRMWETPGSFADISAKDILNSNYINTYYDDMVTHCKWEE